MRVRMPGLVVVAGGVVSACSTGQVTNLTHDSATLNGTVLTGVKPASYVFQIAGRAEDLGSAAGRQTPRVSLAAAPGETPVQARVTDLDAISSGDDFAHRICTRTKALPDADACFATRTFTRPPTGFRRAVFDDPGTVTWTVPTSVAVGTLRSVAATGAQGGSGLDPNRDALGAVVPGGRGGTPPRASR